MSILLDSPDLVMRNVLDKLDMNSILTLRKVSQGLRSFIDTEKPDCQIHNISVTVRKNEDCIELFVNMKEPLSIKYCGKGELTMVVCNDKEKTLKENFIEICLKDLEIMVKNQKSVFEGMWISSPYGFFDGGMMNEFLSGFKNILSSRELKIRTRELEMFVENQNQVMEVLPYLCPETLQEIHLVDSESLNIQLEVNEIMQLEQWKNATIFAAMTFYVNESIRNFSHFLEFYINVQSATLEDILFLKDKLIKLPNFKQMRFTCREFEGEQLLKEFLGPTDYEDSESSTWKYVLEEEARQFTIRNSRKKTFSFCNSQLEK